MKKLLICCIVASFPFAARGACSLSASEFSCSDTNYTDFIKSFYQHSSQNITSPFTITIGDSSFSQIEYFHNLPHITRNITTTKLTIRNSSVESVLDNAFEELIDLQYLDLGFNKLNDILFVQHLPSTVEVLHVHNNNISDIDDVFRRLKHLKYLDLSGNTIRVVDFQSVYRIQFLNFSRNRIDTLVPCERILRTETLDLSHNKIVIFNEEDLSRSFYCLDISWNQLKSLVLARGNKKCLKISGNNISQIFGTSLVEVDEMDLSTTNTSVDLAKAKLIIRNRLLLSNNKIGILNKSSVSILNKIQSFILYRPAVDLSNSSVKDISSHSFEQLHISLLNLSNNNILLLRNKVFLKSSIRILDLSNSNIETIQRLAFKNLLSVNINLKGNKLENTSDIFNEVEVHILDLSFNKFKSVTNRSFLNCRGLSSINLEHCLIEKIEPEAFLGLEKLRHLSLAYNKLFILGTNSLSNFPVEVLNLAGNKIDTIRSKAFNNLPNLKEVNLSKVALRNVEPYAFSNLSRVKTVDLRFNNVTIIPHYLFIGMDNLRAVLLEGNNITTLNPFPNRLRLHVLTLTYKGIFTPNQILDMNIKHLHIKDSKIDMLKSDSFAHLYNLMELHFNGSYVYVETGALNNLFSLKYLDSQSLFKHMKGIKRGTFKDLRSIEYLDLSRISLHFLETMSFVGMVQLETLLLNNNNLTELKGDTFSGLESLKLLDLSECNIDIFDEKSFNGLKTLETLHLERNNLMEIKSELLFENLSNLLDLHLEHNNISMLHNKSFFHLRSLLLLHLQDNYLKDVPIGVFQYLTKLKMLNLSKNVIRLLKPGTLSNLQSLEVLDLSDNQLVNLESVDIFFSMRQLEIVRLDGNHLKQFDIKRLLINLSKIRYVGLSHNKWKCDTLSYMIESINNKSVSYKPEKPVFDNDNIDGVGCVDICKFVYCPQENLEPTLHYY